MNSSHPSSHTHSNSTGPAAPSLTYVYFIGETDTCCYPRSAQVFHEACRLRPDLAQKFATLPNEEIGAMLCRVLDFDYLMKLSAKEPNEVVEAVVVLLMEAFIKSCPQFREAIATGSDSTIYTAFRKVDGSYVLRLCAGLIERRLLSEIEAIGVVRDCLVDPSIKREYESDRFAPTSTYYQIASKKP